MLKLDLDKLPNHKSVGLPYQGSKRKISKRIVGIIKQNFDSMPIYDVFGGLGAITIECCINNLEVHYNDFNPVVTSSFLRVLEKQGDREWLNSLIISRDEFFDIKQRPNKSTDDYIKLLLNSFSNNMNTYLYGKDHCGIKFDLCKKIVQEHDTFSYKQTSTYKEALAKNNLKQLNRLQQIQRLASLEKVQAYSDVLTSIKPTNLDYTAFSHIKNSILYLDPPYQGTSTIGYGGIEFDSLAFYDWAYEMSRNNVVLISSYHVDDNRFKCVFEFNGVISTMCPKRLSRQTEKLFMAVV